MVTMDLWYKVPNLQWWALHTYTVQYAVSRHAASLLLRPEHLTCTKHTAMVHQAVLKQHAGATASGVISAVGCSQLCGRNPNNDIIRGFPKRVFTFLAMVYMPAVQWGKYKKTKIDIDSLIIEVQRRPSLYDTEPPAYRHAEKMGHLWIGHRHSPGNVG